MIDMKAVGTHLATKMTALPHLPLQSQSVSEQSNGVVNVPRRFTQSLSKRTRKTQSNY